VDPRLNFANMKLFLSFLFIIVSSLALAIDTSSLATQSGSIQGEVLEVNDVESYTYLRLKTKDGEQWAAIAKTQIKKGTKATIENVMVMNNFESKSLKKKFETIYFGNLAGSGSAMPSSNGMPNGHPSISKAMETQDVHVPKATGTNARTVMEIITKANELKDKPVLVRGKVVKYNPGIMGKNWIHLRDGTGSAAEVTNDVLVTSTSEVKLGDVVTAKGFVRTDKNFGSGYAYKVILEEATFQ
jgi:hypothetical protein